MSVVLSAPEQIATGTPIPFSFSSQTRVSGRVRLTHGTEALSFRPKRPQIRRALATMKWRAAFRSAWHREFESSIHLAS